jgi:hypothetical protein
LGLFISGPYEIQVIGYWPRHQPFLAYVPRKILSPSRRLDLLVDVDRRKQFYVRFEDRLFRMSTGAIRLATMADADLVPCLIAETSTWKFTIHFGTSVPRHYLGSSPDMQAVGVHLLKEFSKVVSRYPEQCKVITSHVALPENGNSNVFVGAPRAAESHSDRWSRTHRVNVS